MRALARWSVLGWLLGWVGVLAWQAACSPSLGDDGTDPLARLDLDAAGASTDGSGGGSTGLVVSLEPSAPLATAPAVLRVHLSFQGFTFDSTRLFLVEGVIESRELDEITGGEVSAALSKRIVPILTWSEGDGEALAPTAPLQAGAVYTVVMADLPASLEITVESTDAVPLFARLWPPAGGSGTAAFAVWCGDAGAPLVVDPVTLEPSGAPGRIITGVVPNGAGERCLRFEGTQDGAGLPPSVPPPIVSGGSADAGVVRLDPRPLRVDEQAPAPASTACFAGEVPFGPGCVQVLDDRIVGRSAPVPVLWGVAGEGVDAVFAAGPQDPFVVIGLRPSSSIHLDVAAIDAAGRKTRVTFAADTLPPEPHVVINEVLAWPVGPSPAEEWVELFNDGSVAAELDGWVLMVGNAATALPSATLAPGAFALVVGSAFAAADGVDVVAPPSTLVLQVPHLGKEGLSKEGESFELLDALSTPVSSFPSEPKPKQGQSVARVVPYAPDALVSSFALATPTPGRPNVW
jgi:hypothetical protein